MADGSMPAQKRGRSKQDYGTPVDFLTAVQARFGGIAVDLASHVDNHVAPNWFGPGSALVEDSLQHDWSTLNGTLWLNPPFADIAPWAAKCSSVRDRLGWTLMLTPASVGTEWFAEHVMDKALVLFLSPRMAFEGTPVNPKTGRPDGYPKDLMLACFGFGARGFATWRWK